MRFRRLLQSTTMFSGVVGWAFLAVTSAWADDLITKTSSPAATPAPAVDAINTKVDGFGGSLGNLGIYGGNGSITVPLQGPFGAQLDGTVGNLGGDGFAVVSGHWFWRDPAAGLLGLYGSEAYWDRFGGVNAAHVAAEGERYWGPLTLQGIAGVEFGNSGSTTVATVGPVLTTTFTTGVSVPTRFFDEINLKYYFTDNISGYVGQRYLGGQGAVALGGEFAQPLGHGILASAFVEGRVGENNFHGIWGGLKFYFGPTDKPLIARHRQEDPNNWDVDNLFGLVNNQTASGSSFCTLGRASGGGCETPFVGDG